MKGQSSLPDKWVSRGRLITRSTHHEGMFIVENTDGTFHTITTGHQHMYDMNRPDSEVKKLDRKRTKFISSEQYIESVKLLIKSRDNSTRPAPTRKHRPVL